MYVLPAVSAVPAVAAITVLPATGTDMVTSVAVSVGAGLVTWGLLYVVQRGRAL